MARPDGPFLGSVLIWKKLKLSQRLTWFQGKLESSDDVVGS